MMNGCRPSSSKNNDNFKAVKQMTGCNKLFAVKLIKLQA